jgi:hypothetical protein
MILNDHQWFSMINDIHCDSIQIIYVQHDIIDLQWYSLYSMRLYHWTSLNILYHIEYNTHYRIQHISLNIIEYTLYHIDYKLYYNHIDSVQILDHRIYIISHWILYYWISLNIIEYTLYHIEYNVHHGVTHHGVTYHWRSLNIHYIILNIIWFIED